MARAATPAAQSPERTRAAITAHCAALDPPVARTLLVAKIEATAHLRGQAYHLDTHERADGLIEPRGYQWIESFQLDGQVPRWTFALAEAQLVKRVWMIHEHDTTLTTYTHARGADPITLDLKVLCSYRAVPKGCRKEKSGGHPHHRKKRTTEDPGPRGCLYVNS